MARSDAMFIDARRLPKNTVLAADVCIVGAGAAGITLARELIGKSYTVCLLESGGLQYEYETQVLHGGSSVGFPYLPLVATRLRFFGGTTNHWGGACRPLDPLDFRARTWVPHSGWPFTHEHLVPFYQRAHRVLELGPFAYSAADWTSPDLPCAAFSGHAVINAVFQQSPPTRFGQAYREELQRAPNVRTLLHANVLEIHTNESGRTVQRLRVSTLERNDFHVTARYFVLAAGGIETARLLLLSDTVRRNGVGNANGLVGRYFMDHPISGWGKPGSIVPLRLPLRFYHDRVAGKRVVNGAPLSATLWGFIGLSEQTQRRKQMLNSGIALRRLPVPDADGIESARHLRTAAAQRDWPDDFWRHVGNVITDIDDVTTHSFRKLIGAEPPAERVEVMYWAEPQPNPDSRVYLGQERDFFGQRRIVLDWRLTEQDKRNMGQVLNLLATELGKDGIGRLHIDPRVFGDAFEPLLEGSFHHMGTTRMHADPRRGVVNADCRMHEVENLYIASSSVFPAGGHANPTLTIVALALRLADHLKQQMRA